MAILLYFPTTVLYFPYMYHDLQFINDINTCMYIHQSGPLNVVPSRNLGGLQVQVLPRSGFLSFLDLKFNYPTLLFIQFPWL